MLQRVLGLRFVVDVDVGEAFTGLDEVPEMLRLDKGDAGKFAAQVGGVGVAVGGVVEQGVDVVEDVPFGDWRLGIRRLRLGGALHLGVDGAELGQGPVGDVFAAVVAVFVVGVEGEALC